MAGSAVQESDCMRIYNLRLEKYGISKEASNELRAFCLQYPEKKAKVQDILSLKANSLEPKVKKSGFSDPTAKAEEIAEKYLADIELIEKTAQEVDEFLAPWIIKSVTQDVPAWKLAQLENMPANINDFALKRRQFYCLLAIKKKMI